jgi:excisionase family DNA binding protein
VSDQHLTPIELAKRLGVPITTIYNWNSAGGGPPYMKIGRHVRFRLSDVLAWEASRTVDRSRDLGGDAA